MSDSSSGVRDLEVILGFIAIVGSILVLFYPALAIEAVVIIAGIIMVAFAALVIVFPALRGVHIGVLPLNISALYRNRKPGRRIISQRLTSHCLARQAISD